MDHDELDDIPRLLNRIPAPLQVQRLIASSNGSDRILKRRIDDGSVDEEGVPGPSLVGSCTLARSSTARSSVRISDFLASSF